MPNEFYRKTKNCWRNWEGRRGMVKQNVVHFLQPVISRLPVSVPIHAQVVGQLKTVPTAPGQCYDYFDNLTSDRSHSFAFQLDQTRRVSIDIANHHRLNLLTGWFNSQHIEVVLWSEGGQQQELFSVAPGDRDRETITLKAGRYLLELKTYTDQKINYVLKFTAMKWLLLECLAS